MGGGAMTVDATDSQLRVPKLHLLGTFGRIVFRGDSPKVGAAGSMSAPQNLQCSRQKTCDEVDSLSFSSKGK